MNSFNPETKQITSEWLTSILSKNGFLTKGKVIFVDQENTLSDVAIVSNFFSLKIYYSEDASGALPSKILMKLNQGKFYVMGEKEVNFYEIIATTKAALPLATCYWAEKSSEAKECCILLDDLTDTHAPPETAWPLPPPEEQCKEAVVALAKMHSSWWNHSRLGEPGFEMPENWGPAWTQRAEKLFPEFVTSAGDCLSEKEKKTYELLFEKLTGLIRGRLSPSKGVTLLHGDAHFWNFLYPRNKAKDQCIIIDWQLWKVGLGAFDLSYMIALHWYPEHRKRMEHPLLKNFYLEEMQKQNIDYQWDDFWEDYRVSVIFNLLYPVLLNAKGVPPFIWEPHLERGFAAFDDLNCLELLG